MARQVVWKKKALKKFKEIVEYLEKELSEKVVGKFVVKLDDLIEIFNASCHDTIDNEDELLSKFNE